MPLAIGVQGNSKKEPNKLEPEMILDQVRMPKEPCKRAVLHSKETY